MNQTYERQQNQAAYRQLKESIAQEYEKGRFVAIAEGRVVADADTLDELRNVFEAQGKDFRCVLVVQAGMQYPEGAIIFMLDDVKHVCRPVLPDRIKLQPDAHMGGFTMERVEVAR